MSTPALTTRRRSLAAVAVLLFSLLALAAALPHEHGGGVASPTGHGISAAAFADTSAQCPLCDWLASPRLSVASPDLLLLTAAVLTLFLTPLLPALLSAPAPRRRSRAPPAFTL